MNDPTYAAVSSIFTLGGLIGALAAGPYSSRVGRIRPMRLTAPFFLAGSILETLAPNPVVMGIGRFLSGIGAGASIVIVPIYISEIAPESARGALGASTQVGINIGILITQVLGYFLSRGNLWRIILGAGGCIAVLQAVGLVGVVESPEWLASKGRVGDATRTLQKLRGGNAGEEADKWGDEDDANETQGLLDQRGETGSTSSSRRGGKEEVGFFEVARHPDHWRAIVAVVAVMIAQQFSGINAVMMYSKYFLKGIMPTGADLITVAVGVLNLIVTAACAPLADKLGRKTCLLASIAGMAINAMLLGIGLAKNIQILCAICTLLFVASFAVGLGPVPFILASELVGPEAVGATQSWALGANWVATFIVAQFFPVLDNALGKGQVFWLFTALGAIFFTFIAWWVPESKGRKDADEVWGRESRHHRVD